MPDSPLDLEAVRARMPFCSQRIMRQLIDRVTELEEINARLVCPHGDRQCPCPDGLLCHYEGPDPMACDCDLHDGRGA